MNWVSIFSTNQTIDKAIEEFCRDEFIEQYNVTFDGTSVAYITSQFSGTVYHLRWEIEQWIASRLGPKTHPPIAQLLTSLCPPPAQHRPLRRRR